MGISKIIYGDETLIDLTKDTVTPETLLEGFTAHSADGELIVGTLPPSTESDEEPVDELWLPKDDNTVYFLVDTDNLGAYKTVCYSASGSGTVYMTIGHLNDDRQFVADSNRIAPSNSSKTYLDFTPYENTGYKVIKAEVPTTRTNFGLTAGYVSNGTTNLTPSATNFLLDFPVISVAWNIPRLESQGSIAFTLIRRFVLTKECVLRTSSQTISFFTNRPYLEYCDLRGICESTGTIPIMSNNFRLKTFLTRSSFNSQNLTSGVSNAFAQCRNLKKIETKFLTLTGCTTFSGIFNGCMSLTQFGFTPDLIDLSYCGTTNKITSWANCFTNCNTAKYIDMRGHDFTNVTTLASLFQNCYELVRAYFDFSTTTTKLNTIASLFQNCYKYEGDNGVLDLSSLDLSSVTTLSASFQYCLGLKKIILGSGGTKITTLANVFGYCYNLEEVDIDGLNLSACTSVATAFQSCRKLKRIPSALKTLTNKLTTLSGTFQNCDGLVEIDLSGIDTSNVTTVSNMCVTCSSAVTLNLSGCNFNKCTASQTTPFRYMTSLENVICDNAILPQNSFSFQDSIKLTHASALSIINALPTVSSTKTLTFATNVYNTLTADEIAVATAKKWTVAKA